MNDIMRSCKCLIRTNKISCLIPIKSHVSLKMSAIELLQKLIATPSFSGEENETATILFDLLQSKGVQPIRFKNNVWARSSQYDPAKPTLLLNSHHDTVKPASGYTRDPFEPSVENGILYGLGSNDAGASVVALLHAFCSLYNECLAYNLLIAITAEEEALCQNGISALWPELGRVDCALVGEPTQMQAAVAERGLLVLDGVAKGVSGHAARNEGDNALYHACDDIQWFRSFAFPKLSDRMGAVKMTVTQINAGTQHNVVPDRCTFTVDIRPTDEYRNQEIVDIVRQHIRSEVTPRSLHLNASAIPDSHSLVQTAHRMGIPCYVSPTTSDISRISVPALKMGPGDSARSHTANEYIKVQEVLDGIKGYELFLRNLV